MKFKYDILKHRLYDVFQTIKKLLYNAWIKISIIL